MVDGYSVSGAINVKINGGDIKYLRPKANASHTSNEFNLVISNAVIENIYYEPDKETEITINNDSKITNISAETYSKDSKEKVCNININTINPINIDGKNKGNSNINFDSISIDNYSASITNVKNINIKDSNINYTNVINNIGELETENSSININVEQLGILNLNINDNSKLEIGDKVRTLTLGTINFDTKSTIKILSTMTTVKTNGDFNGGGNIYLNDNIRLEISGKVTNSTTVYCNNNDKEYFTQGTMIIAKVSEQTLENSFITPDGQAWNFKDNESTRMWQVDEFIINDIIYINSKTGTNYGLGTKDIPTNSLENAYKIVNKRYEENNQDKKYYIVLQEDLTVNKTLKQNFNDELEIVLTNTVQREDIKYNTSLKINNSTFNFGGKTTLENITIDTTGYSNSVEFFANGNDIIFGNEIIIKSQEQLYPIIYAGKENENVTKEEIKLTVLSGIYNMIFGGGKNKGADVTANINLTIGNINLKGYAKDDDTYTGIFGAGLNGNVKGNINLNIEAGNFHRIYGAGLDGKVTGDVTINFKGGKTTRLYGGGLNGEVDGNIHINLGNSESTVTVSKFLRGSGQYSGITGNTYVNIYSGTNLLEHTQVAAGGYQGNVAESNLKIYGGNINCDLYGGGWGIVGDYSKGLSGNTNVYIYPDVKINGDIYGGGYAGTADNTNVIIEKATVNNVYGGGNEAQINISTNVKLTDANINENAYAGGKGVTATVKGDSTIIVNGKTIIENNLFGGGNASMTGLVDNNSTTNVYIIGGTIKQDVYGGANTSVVYGNTNVKIGKLAVENTNTVNMEEMKQADINIKGTVFGGGKSNAAGSENYDFTFESVTGDVNIDIDAKDAEINIEKSIFASGNAAKISGNGYVRIANYGIYGEPKKLTSIQRATIVNIEKSALWIIGTTDRTNEMSTMKYSVNRVKTLQFKDNSIVYLESPVNLVESLVSLDKDDSLEYVTIDAENGIIEQNVDNKVYLLHGKNVTLLREDGGNGSVHGMMFLGKFDSNKTTGIIEMGIYSPEYRQGDKIEETHKNKLAKNSYLQAQHYESHDIAKDGFYTNNFTEDSKISIQYIQPTPEDATYYQWLIGNSETIYYEDIELIASKYSSTAQVTLDLVGLNAPEMTLTVKNIDVSLLNTDVIIKDEIQIPNIAENEEKANSEFGLTMENGHQGWKANSRTTYLYQNKIGGDENKFGIVQGATTYYADKSNATPTLTFNFAHSKNVSENIDLGKVSINLIATYMEDDALISKNVVIELILRVVNTESSEIDYYEGAITPGLEYNVFPSATTNITSKSSISAYYSIYLGQYNTEKYYENYEGYYHVIYSSFVLPKETKIVIIDRSSNKDKYYYYIVTEEDEKNKKMLYKFSDFITMGTFEQKYNDDANYYNRENNYILEEFIVQLDFKNAQITENHLKQTIKIQLMDKKDDSIRLTVNDTVYPMIYNIYTNQEGEKDLTIDKKEDINLYEPKDLEFKITTKYSNKIVDSNLVYDTTSHDYAQGLKATFYLEGKKLSKEQLEGVSITYDDIPYFVNESGAISFKISDLACNLATKIKLNLTQKQKWDAGIYTIKFENFTSTDGINPLNYIDSENITITFFNNEYGLDVILDSNSQIIDKETGNTLNEDNKLDFNIKYEKGLENPEIRVALYRRNYETIYSPEYELVDLKEIVTNDLELSNKEKEYIVTDSPTDNQQFVLSLKDNRKLKTGTYKIKFLIYDGNNYMGEVYKMIIIR